MLRSLGKIWLWLTTPAPAVEPPDQRRQARLLISLLALLVVFVFLTAVVSGASRPATSVWQNAEFTQSLVIAAFLGVAFGISRTRHYRLAAVLTVVTLSVSIFVSATYDGEPTSVFFFAYLVLPVLFSSLFLSLGATVALIAVNTAGILLTPLFFPGVLVGDLPVFFFLIVSISVVMVTRSRDLLERDRRAQLMEMQRALKQAHDELAARSTVRYRALFEQTNDAIFLLDLDGRHLAANRRAADMLGYTVDEIIGMSFQQIVAPPAQAESRQVLEVLKAGGRLPLYERVFRKKDGTEFPVEINVELVRDETGAPLHVQSIIRDITKRRQIENLLRIQRDLAFVLGSADDLTAAARQILRACLQIEGIDGGGVYLVNERDGAIELLTYEGLSPEFVAVARRHDAGSSQVRLVMAGEPVYLHSLEYDSGTSELRRREGMRTLAVIPIQYEGRTVAVLNLASRICDEVPVYTRAALEAIAIQAGGVVARVRTQTALRESQQNLQALFDTLDDLLFILDSDAQIIHANPAAQRRLGYAFDELLKLKMPDVHSSMHRDEAVAQCRAVLKGEVSVYTVPLMTRDGVLIPVETRFTRGRWGERDVWFGVSRDITHLKATEGELRRHRDYLEELVADRTRELVDANARLRETERFLQSTLDALSAHIAILDETGTIIAVNAAWRSFGAANGLDWPVGGVGANYLTVCDDAAGERSEEAPAVAQGIRDVLAGRHVQAAFEYPCHGPHEKRWFVMRITRFEYDGLPRVVVAHENITQRRQAEEALRKNEQRLRGLFNSSPDIIYAYDLSAHAMIFINRTRLLGYDMDEISRPESVLHRIHPDHRANVLACWDAASAGAAGEVHTAEFSIQARDGHYWEWVEMRSTVSARNPDGSAKELLVTLTAITERKAMQEALWQAEEQVRTFVESVDDMIYFLGLDGSYKMLNTAYERITGRPVEDAPFEHSIHPDDLELLRQLSLTYPEGADMLETEYRLQDKAEEWRWIQSHRVGVKDAEGRYVGYNCIDRDITERRQIEDKAKQYALQLMLINEMSGQITSVLDLDSLLEMAVYLVQEIFAYQHVGLFMLTQPQGELALRARAGEYAALLPDDHRLAWGQGLVGWAAQHGETVLVDDVSADPRYHNPFSDRVVGSELSVPLRMRDKLLGVLDVQSRQTDAFDANDRVMLEILSDQIAVAIQNAQLYQELETHAARLGQIVEERTMELQRSRERIEAIFNSSSDAIILVDADGTISQVNLMFCQLFDYYDDEYFRMPLTALVEAGCADTLEAAWRQVLRADGLSTRVEVIARSRDGTTFHAEMGLASLSTTEGFDRSIVCILRDITERVLAEEQLRQTLEKERELGALKSRFVSMVSHEFRTPLATILLSANALERYMDRMQAEVRARHFKKIETAIRYMTRLLENVLFIGRTEAGRMGFAPKPTDVERFCRGVVEEAQMVAGAKHVLRFACQGRCADLAVDENLLQHILTNLLSNAVKYSPEGGTVWCDLSCTAERITLRVRDEGIGIPLKDQVHLFETFHRGENVGNISGTGLGLAIVKRAVETHGGIIDFESQAGKGTTFTVVLPVAQPGERHDEDPSD
ncbi:MAG: PAS domain S-box protein [Anaerolineae bacterium]|nr:PAS domain S-box protein [Anaerolineae bacterium]